MILYGCLLQTLNPSLLMLSLIDTIQPDFDLATLDQHSDADLFALQTKNDRSIAAWHKQQQPLDVHEQVWLNELLTLADAIRNTLNRRYGCND